MRAPYASVMSVELDEVYGFLRKHEPFSNLPEDQLRALPARMGITYVRRGEVIVRQRYSLPAYSNHNALTDAIACAELYLVSTAE